MRLATARTACVALAATLVAAGIVFAQAADSAAAKATRKKLQQKISVDFKEVGIKAIFDDIKSEMDPAVSFKIDNASGISNNTKLSFTAKDKTVEEILNGISDKGEFGWFVKSDPKDRNDGFVILRKFKEKERGVESGKK